ncbi:extracellular solute-binding protein [Paenibacillus sp. LMG 31458]|uniref:Extracellular solute-binding protein n=1 Tax=Paenibacillus phytorum TaxID=2654977 RepID=A0ABX1Y5K8_9BACL|nr:extracellular solute-binding protein [Paenibacillus phytorum]NOU75744.1 extracellular solute-binding protein [Paenibacillus phytorum]
MGVKQVVASVVVMGAVLSTFAGCSKSNEDQPGKESAQPLAIDSSGRKIEGNMYVSGYPIVKDKQTIKVAYNDVWSSPDFNTKKVMQMVEEKTNIHVQWDQIPNTSYNDRVNLMFASNDLPEVFMNASLGANLSLAKEQGQIIDVKDLIDNYAPNIKKALDSNPDYKKMATDLDGKIYSIPSFLSNGNLNYGDTLFLNKKWLEKLNLSVPTTTDEFYQVLKAFKEKDPNGNGQADEIPFTVIWGTGNTGSVNLFGPWGTVSVAGSATNSSSGNIFIIKDNKVVAASMIPGYKDAVKYWSKLYQEGLLDKEAFTQDSKAFFAKTTKEPYYVGGWTGYGGWNEAGSLQKSKDNFASVLPLKGPDGQQNWLKVISGITLNQNFITKAAKDPKTIIRWMDAIAEPEISYQWSFGPMGSNVEKTADGKLKLAATPSGTPYGQFRVTNTVPFGTLGIYKEWADKNMILDENTVYKSQIDDSYEPYGTISNLSNLKFTKEQNTQLATYATNLADIQNYTRSKEAEWIIKGTIDAEWDAYLKKLNDLKIGEIIKIYQQGLVNYNNLK